MQSGASVPDYAHRRIASMRTVTITATPVAGARYVEMASAATHHINAIFLATDIEMRTCSTVTA